ncbi:UDP-N-acetylglucosamine 2-epimerase, partial [Streptomyces venezuelae]|uniref:UDP-N-acetylglucosamine 2-epimerase n=1 Tax=Streptomyces venezuelae TaxID=54571 RepID=UPI001F4751D0
MKTLPARSVAVVLGTRPELVKLAELIRALGPAARVVHTGQHYDDALSGDFLDELGLPEPEYLTGVGGQPRAVQVAAALTALDERFAADPPLAVVVQGDTNAALSGALAANARDLPLVHVEAGLRSHDRAMPEEHNRVLIDRLADVLCAATPDNRALLLAEGIADERIAVTGNTDDPAALTAVLTELAALARDLPLVHVEAGLRSHDRAMPEEHNRVLIDRLADVLCAA